MSVVVVVVWKAVLREESVERPLECGRPVVVVVLKTVPWEERLARRLLDCGTPDVMVVVSDGATRMPRSW
ncbi:hypothetical protein VTK73DRAFT_2712 [Phialemonium thermophilum]|uniref:Glycosyltransferase n=1 Tax=Phialemonium thermophilum TaxID=223376 RepID=A0ABR3VPK3_9PEZI